MDVLVMGGGIAGLLAAREMASSLDVLVVEEDQEIGHPEKCDGLVTLRALKELGMAPRPSLIQNRIERALLVSPSGIEVEVEAYRQQVVVVDRRRLDRLAAEMAVDAGARISIGARVERIEQLPQGVRAYTRGSALEARIGIDARGAQAYKGGGSTLLQAAKYEVKGDWFEEDKVELHFDQERTPGFFSWIIPMGERMAKVGVAGRGINTFTTLEAFLRRRAKGRYSILKRVAAPLVVGGPFGLVEGNLLRVGDAAGQSKPTTAGGIYTGGMAGILAGRAALRAHTDGFDALPRYERDWKYLFDEEVKRMLAFRKVFQGLSNKEIDRLFSIIKDSDLPSELSEKGDFDLHALSLMKAFTARQLIGLGSIALSAGLRALLEVLGVGK